MRADDVPEYVQDGVVDCGITGLDIVRERGADVLELQRLGFGACTLEAAVPTESDAQSLDDLRGARVATSFPRLARELLPVRRSSSSTCTARSSSRRVSASPTRSSTSSRAAARCARTACARSALLLESEAVLIGPPRAGAEDAVQLAGVFRSVVDARGARYLMLNAPEDVARGDLRARPRLARAERAAARGAGHGRRAQRRPRRRRLALLPALEAAGASSILLVPVERMLG